MNNIAYSINKVSVDFGYEELLSIDTLSIYKGERVAIIGDNGSGKSTLLKMLAGQLQPSEGHIKCYTDFSYIAQMQEEVIEGIKDYDVLSSTGLLSKCQGAHSAGERTLNRVISAVSEVKPTLILDEPTTYLDSQGIDELISMLQFSHDTLIFVSHNVEFINALADKIWVVEDKTIKEYYGNYRDYQRIKAVESVQRDNERKQYLSKKKHLEAVVEKKAKQVDKASKVSKKSKNKNIKPNRLASTKQKDTVQKRLNASMKAAQKRIDKLEEVSSQKSKRPVVYPDIQFESQNSTYPIILDELVLRIEDRTLLDHVDLQVKNGSKICIKGQNGSGKSTLLNHIYNRDQVMVSSTSKIGYFNQFDQVTSENDTVYNSMKGLDYMPDHFINAVLINLGFDYKDLKRPVSTLSGGEKIRLKLASVFLKKSNILLLDEPTTFLDISTKESLCKMIKDYPGTVIFVSHDNEFVNNTADHIYSIDNQQLNLLM